MRRKMEKMNSPPILRIVASETVDGIPHRVVADCGSKRAYVVLTD
jgi:hypothetical protein